MQKLRLLLGVGLLATLLAVGPVACGDDDEDENGGNGEPTATEEPADGDQTPADGDQTPEE